MLEIRTLDKSEVPGHLDHSIIQGSNRVVEIEGGRLGWAGIKITSIGTNKAFMWYVPNEKPTLQDLYWMRKQFDEWRDYNLWMTIKKEDKGLARWAKFLRLEKAGEYDKDNWLYRRA